MHLPHFVRPGDDENPFTDDLVYRWKEGDPIGPIYGDMRCYIGPEGGPASSYELLVAVGDGEADPWAWNWHHMLDQDIFDEEFLAKHGLTGKIDINNPKYGWMLRAKDHFPLLPVNSCTRLVRRP